MGLPLVRARLVSGAECSSLYPFWRFLYPSLIWAGTMRFLYPFESFVEFFVSQGDRNRDRHPLAL
jgi:hypothetical protein